MLTRLFQLRDGKTSLRGGLADFKAKISECFLTLGFISFTACPPLQECDLRRDSVKRTENPVGNSTAWTRHDRAYRTLHNHEERMMTGGKIDASNLPLDEEFGAVEGRCGSKDSVKSI